MPADAVPRLPCTFQSRKQYTRILCQEIGSPRKTCQQDTTRRCWSPRQRTRPSGSNSTHSPSSLPFAQQTLSIRRHTPHTTYNLATVLGRVCRGRSNTPQPCPYRVASRDARIQTAQTMMNGKDMLVCHPRTFSSSRRQGIARHPRTPSSMCPPDTASTGSHRCQRRCQCSASQSLPCTSPQCNYRTPSRCRVR
jgi:hypothetical protein